MTTQGDLFDGQRTADAAHRAAAWQTCRRAAAALDATPAGTVERALAVEVLCTARILKDLADGFAPADLDPTGLAFHGYGRGTVAGDAMERGLRGPQ